MEEKERKYAVWVDPETDILINKCVIYLKERYKKTPIYGKKIHKYTVVEEAMRLYWAFIRGYLPEDIVREAINLLDNYERALEIERERERKAIKERYLHIIKSKGEM